MTDMSIFVRSLALLVYKNAYFNTLTLSHETHKETDVTFYKLALMFLLNPLTYKEGGGGLFIQDHQIIDNNSKTALPAPPNWVTFCFYLLNTFWQNFSKIDSPGGLLQLFLK